MGTKNRRKLKNISAAVLAFLLTASLALPGFVYAEEEETEIRPQSSGISSQTGDDHIFSAVLYDTAEYGSDTDKGIPLTEEGVVLDGWTFNTSKYLQVDLSVPTSENTVHMVTIKLPKELYVVGSVENIPTGFSRVEFQKNEDIPVNLDGTYTVNENSGTLTYYLNPNMEHSALQLELRYDNTFWDKEKNSALTEDGVFPIEVSLSHEDTENYPPEEELPSLKLEKITVGDEMALSSVAYMRRPGESSYTTITADKDVELTILENLNTAVYSDALLYYQDILLDIALPFYQDPEGENHYLDYDDTRFAMGNFVNGSADYEIQERSASNLKVKVTRPLYKVGNLFTLPISYPKDLETDVNAVTFTGGSIRVTGTSNSGTKDVLICSNNIGSITYYVKPSEKVVLAGMNRSVTCKDRMEGAVSVLGGFYIENQGTEESTEKEIQISFADGLLVTTLNLPTDTVSENIEVNYTLVDENGERVYLDESGVRVSSERPGAEGSWSYTLPNKYYKSTTKNNLFNRFIRSMLPDAQQDYYFKTVTYSIKAIQAESKLYASGSMASPTSAGNYFGYVQASVEAEKGLTSTVTVTSPEESGITELLARPVTTPTVINYPSYGIQSVDMSKSSIQAGESVTVSGAVFVVGYPYGYSDWLKGIRIGVVLPKGASINEDSILLGNGAVRKDSLKTKEIGDGNVLWIIYVDPEFGIGYYTEELKALENGNSMKFSFQIETAKDMNASTLFSDLMLYTAGDDQRNSAGGSNSWTSYVDVWDLNNNGRTDDKIGGSMSASRKICTIIPNSAVLDISDYVTVTGAGSSDGGTASLKAETDTVTYTLDIKCLDGGAASTFEYYIPVPKTASGRDNYLTGGNEEDAFNFEMLGAAAVKGSTIYTIRYTNMTGLTYTNARGVSEEAWFTADQINNNEAGFGWKDVTLLKLTAAEDKIENGSENSISINLRYSGENYPAEAGMNNIWKSCGYYTYAAGTRVTTGHFPTEGCSAVLNYAWSNTEAQEKVVLTAAKNMQPTEPNIREKTVREAADGGDNSFPQFKNAQTFRITGIQTVNVTLQTKEYLQQNQTTLSGIDANQTFGLTVEMGDLGEVDFKDGIEKEIGTSDASTAPQFTFRLYNADAISDITTERSVLVTLTSNKGVTIQVKIDINRELALADDPKSAITAGKVYIPFAETTDKVTISQDSAFTAQFINQYIPSTYTGARTITFSEALPEGTTLLLADVTNIANPGYWYYKLDGTETEAAFTEMSAVGTLGTKNYVPPTGNDLYSERLLLVVDFSECGQFPAAGVYTVGMTIGGSEGIEDIKTGLTFVTEEKRSFALSGEDTASVNADYALTYTTEGPGCAESNYDGRRLSLVITPESGSELPEDACLQIGNTKYYRNEKNQFILPLEQIKTGLSENGDAAKTQEIITMRLSSADVPKEGGSYSLRMELWASATNNGSGPLLGEKTAEKMVVFSAQSVPQPAWKVTGMTPRLLHRKDLGRDVSVSCQSAALDACIVTVELQQKQAAGYVTRTDVMSSVNGSTVHSSGVFTLNNPGSGQVKFRLSSSTTETGTYRLLFRVKAADGSPLLEIPYNFIVAD